MCSLPTLIVGARKRIFDFREEAFEFLLEGVTSVKYSTYTYIAFHEFPVNISTIEQVQLFGIFQETSDERWKISICSLQKLSHCIKGMMNNSWKLCNRNSTFTLYSQYIEIYAEKWVTYDTDWSNCRQQDSFHNPPLHMIYCDAITIYL